MKKKRHQRRHSKEFKDEAVALITKQGYTVSEASKALGVTKSLLYKWKSSLDAKQSGQNLSEDEKTELVKLRRENKRLRMEKEILKKASAFFAREMK